MWPIGSAACRSCSGTPVPRSPARARTTTPRRPRNPSGKAGPRIAPRRRWPRSPPQRAVRHQQAWAKHLGLPVEFTNSLGMTFVLIPPGEFTMGSVPAEIAAALEIQQEPHWRRCIQSQGPQHRVILTQPFYLGLHNVTQAEYEQLMGKNPSYFAPATEEAGSVRGLDTSRFPVEQVTWVEANEFCAKLSVREQLTAEGLRYRLPTEVQWEFACRAGTTTSHSSSDEDLPQAAWFAGNSAGRTHAVGELQANPFGLFDMEGNVWDWVQDEWGPTYYEQFQDTPAIDPSGPATGNSYRVARGGDWNLPPSHGLASSRVGHGLGTIDRSVGMRLSLPVAAVKVSRQGPARKVAP